MTTNKSRTKLMPVVDAVYEVTGVRFHQTTVHRWCKKPNCNGFLLESTRLGSQIFTTIENVERYVTAGTEAMKNGG